MTLHRHALHRLTAAGWQDVLARPWDDEARACLALWSARDLPLVVARQSLALHPGRVATGLPAPAAFGRRRIAIEAARAALRPHGGFPCMADVEPLIAEVWRPAWRRLTASIAALGCEARVYGSHGWQALTGLRHVHRDSDIDLLLPAADPARADAICKVLVAFRWTGPRLDGELLFADGAGIAWREWAARSPRGLLVKRTGWVGIESPAC